MPRNKEIKKVLVIGSGPIVIGQAAEFDYAGTQACRSLKEEGLEVVLLNSNPATIMTDKDIAGENGLPTKTLHAAALCVTVATVTRTAACFFMCHEGISLHFGLRLR